MHLFYYKHWLPLIILLIQTLKENEVKRVFFMFFKGGHGTNNKPKISLIFIVRKNISALVSACHFHIFNIILALLYWHIQIVCNLIYFYSYSASYYLREEPNVYLPTFIDVNGLENDEGGFNDAFLRAFLEGKIKEGENLIELYEMFKKNEDRVIEELSQRPNYLKIDRIIVVTTADPVVPLPNNLFKGIRKVANCFGGNINYLLLYKRTTSLLSMTPSSSNISVQIPWLSRKKQVKSGLCSLWTSLIRQKNPNKHKIKITHVKYLLFIFKSLTCWTCKLVATITFLKKNQQPTKQKKTRRKSKIILVH